MMHDGTRVNHCVCIARIYKVGISDTIVTVTINSACNVTRYKYAEISRSADHENHRYGAPNFVTATT